MSRTQTSVTLAGTTVSLTGTYKKGRPLSTADRQQPPTDETRAPLRTVARALQVLDSFRYEPSLGIREIARRVGISPAAAHRVVGTLATFGYLSQDVHTRTYRLGPRIEELSQTVARTPDVRRSALGYMRRLQEVTQETVCLHGVRDGSRACLLQLESPQELRMVIPLRPLPILQGASDLIFHAFSPPELRELFKRGEDGAASSESVEPVPDLDAIRQTGWAATADTRFPGGAAVAAPVRTTSELLVLSVFGPEQRMNEQGIEKIASDLTSIAGELAAALNALGEALAADLSPSAS